MIWCASRCIIVGKGGKDMKMDCPDIGEVSFAHLVMVVATLLSTVNLPFSPL